MRKINRRRTQKEEGGPLSEAMFRTISQLNVGFLYSKLAEVLEQKEGLRVTPTLRVANLDSVESHVYGRTLCSEA